MGKIYFKTLMVNPYYQIEFQFKTKSLGNFNFMNIKI